MGRKVHIDTVRKFAKTTPVFTARDVESLVGERRYALLMLHQMAKRGELHRVARGFYSLHEDPVVSVFALRPAYVGLQDALSVRDLWEQETNVVLVTAGRCKPGAREFMGSRVIVHRICPRYFFGFDYLRYPGGLYVPVSNLEKTLIDFVYFRELPGKDVVAELASRADPSVLEGYLARYHAGFVAKFRRVVGTRGVERPARLQNEWNRTPQERPNSPHDAK